MHADLYISMETQPDIALVDGALSPNWQRIGELDGFRETDAWKRVRPFIGLGGISGKGVTFWVDGDATSQFVQMVTARAPCISHGSGASGLSDVRFWIALDLRKYHNRYLVSNARASFKDPVRRTPEPHPAYATQAVFLPIHITATGGCVFRKVDA